MALTWLFNFLRKLFVLQYNCKSIIGCGEQRKTDHAISANSILWMQRLCRTLFTQLCQREGFPIITFYIAPMQDYTILQLNTVAQLTGVNLRVGLERPLEHRYLSVCLYTVLIFNGINGMKLMRWYDTRAVIKDHHHGPTSPIILQDPSQLKWARLQSCNGKQETFLDP